MREIGWLSSVSCGTSEAFLRAFLDALAGQGFVQDPNLSIRYAFANGDYNELKALANGLVKPEVALIVAGGAVSAENAKNATSQIPILFLSGYDPVKLGLVKSIPKPGGNATGVNLFTTELIKLRLQLIDEVVSSRKKPIAFLVNGAPEVKEIEKDDAKTVSESLGVKVLLLDASTDDKIEQSFSAIKDEAGALIVSADPFLNSRRQKIVDLAARYRLPGCYPWKEYVDAGGLLSYGPDLISAYGQVGEYAGKILKGTNVAELPVVQPTKYKLFINYKVAKSLGLEIPRDVRARAE